ncbi:c-type cytochrome biogenesis protein CcmI [Janthinobacterium sp. 17J80-10]|uniref:c-type cytochrome biogenesis protein CcmI n=1 Tax=Janthinobacterium sp. 17J80-10 TaxID=2497863 RepID=UPI0010058BBB|nr:c-type cytochrome biogenesis protein CcmI [Janthinobacterium sp. 17J80-10]QAU35475.1 c-type cytochrome biogenesis protein CcmI [Janthinobacterium sp. 17J80-10]
MSAFLLAAFALTACALLFLLPPLLRRDDAEEGQVRRDDLNLAVLRDQLRELEADLAAGVIGRAAYDSARLELERRVAEEVGLPARVATARAPARWTSAGLLLALPALASVLYILLGSPLALESVRDNPHDAAPQPIEAMVEALAQRLKDRPDDIEGWHMLARSYNALERHRDASNAYAHLLAKTPGDADLLADYADTLAMVLNRSLQGEPEKLVERALAIDPGHFKALALAGSAAFERRDYAAALTRWQKIMDLAPADSEIARSTTASMNEARAMMGKGAPATAKAPVAAASQVAVAGDHRLEGRVEIDPALRAQVKDSDTVFIYARAVSGPRFPLAVLRKQVRDLPVSFVLDDSMAMMPGSKLSDHATVVVGARISRTGSATPSPGEPQVLVESVPRGAKKLQLRLAASGG